MLHIHPLTDNFLSVEADPLGSNVGLHTPYFEINPNPNEPDVAPPLTSTWNSFPGKVGQIEHAAIDGMQVPLWFGLAALRNGSAIPASLEPYQNLPGFIFDDNGLGIYTVRIPKQVGWHVNPDNSVSRVYSKVSFDTFTFSAPWNPSQQPQQSEDNIEIINHCKLFAKSVQSLGNWALNLKNKSDAEKAYAFAKELVSRYTGGWWDDEGWRTYKSKRGGILLNVSQSKSQSGDPAKDPAWAESNKANHHLLGHGGYKEKYQDKSFFNPDPKVSAEDVGHHLAAYIGLGATNNNVIAGGFISAETLGGDTGDINGANDGFTLGISIYNDIETLKTIGRTFQDTFCSSDEDWVPDTQR